MPAARRSGELRPSAATTRRQSMRRAAGDAHGGAIVAPLHLGRGRREHAQRRQRVHVRVQRHAQAARLHHVAERPRSPALAVVEMQEQRRGRPAEAAVADADVEDRAGRLGQPVPDAGVLQQAARAGGDGVGAAVEGRVLHRRQWRHDPPRRWRCRRRPAGRPACRRPDRRRPRRPRPTGARSCRRQWRGRHSAGKPLAMALLRSGGSGI